MYYLVLTIMFSFTLTTQAQGDVVDFGDSGIVVVVQNGESEGFQTGTAYVFYDEFFANVNPWRFLPGIPVIPPNPFPPTDPSPDPEIDCAELWQGITDSLNLIQQLEDLIETLTNGDLWVGVSGADTPLYYEVYPRGHPEHSSRLLEARQDLADAKEKSKEKVNDLPEACLEEN